MPADVIVLDAPFRDLPIDSVKHVGLRLPDALGNLLTAADDIERAPG